MRAYRRRLRAGRSVYRLELDVVDIAELLLAADLIAPGEADDRAAHARGLQRLLKLLQAQRYP